MELENTWAETAVSGGAGAEGEELEALARGAAVGRFTLLGTLGAGGMGVVYAAHDPELDRKVALKLLLPRAGGSSDSGGRSRLMREAQALAKLSHPNVVAVHDVGTHGDSVWIAMEFVAGQTLAAWAEARPRRWSEVLPVLADVARGVAAAHEAGLVHRDLKPDNVMIGQGGRVRVMDFGLAHGRGPAVTEPEIASTSATGAALIATPAAGTALASTLVAATGTGSGRAALVSRLTAMGAVQGTPAYMAPEQWQGREAEPATDQFGWSVMAWELLYREPPFVGETVADLAAAVMAGQRRPPPRASRVPGWLRRVIERGMATEPARRWPTMAALLAALERGKARARMGAVAAAVAGVALLGAGAEGARRWDIGRRVAACEAAGATIDHAWNDDTRQRLRDAFAATGVSDAATTADKVMPWLDERAGAWKQARTEVCLNADVRARWGAELLDRAMWCLEDREMARDSLVAELGRANATSMRRAVLAVASLRSADACLDEEVLRRQPAPPRQGRAAIREVRAQFSRADSLATEGRFKEALTIATEARERAEAVTDWPPLLASALAHEGHLLEEAGAFDEAEAVSRRAYFVAARAGAWDVAADGANSLVYIVGHKQARHAEGRIWAEHAEVALLQAGDPQGLAEAQRLNSLATVLSHTDAFAEARALHERALEIGERVLGPLHPNVARTLNNLAIMHMHMGAPAEARAMFERALAIQERALGPGSPLVAEALNNLAILHQLAGEYAEARTLLGRALAIKEQAFGPDHPDVGSCLNNLANLLESTGEYSEARALHERSLAITEKALGPEHPDAAQSLYNIATVHIATGAYAEARALLERALAIQEKALGPDHLAVAQSLDSLANVQLAEARPRDALPLSERAVAIFSAHEGGQEGEHRAHFHLARARLATGGDRAGALAMARTARDGLREEGPLEARKLAEAERWLAEQDGEP